MIHSRYLDQNITQALDRQVAYSSHLRKLQEINKEREEMRIKKKNKTKDVDNMMTRQYRNKVKSNDFQESERLNEIKRTNQKLLEKLMDISKGKWSSVRPKGHLTSKSIGAPASTSFHPGNTTALAPSGPSGGIASHSALSNNTTRVGNWQRSLIAVRQREEQQRIDSENQILLQRILNQGSSLSKKKLQVEYQKNVQYKNQIKFSNKVPYSRMIRKSKNAKGSPLPHELPPIRSSKALTPGRISQVCFLEDQNIQNDESTTIIIPHQGQAFSARFSKTIDQNERKPINPLSSRASFDKSPNLNKTARLKQIANQRKATPEMNRIIKSEKKSNNQSPPIPPQPPRAIQARFKQPQKAKPGVVYQRKQFKMAHISKSTSGKIEKKETSPSKHSSVRQVKQSKQSRRQSSVKSHKSSKSIKEKSDRESYSSSKKPVESEVNDIEIKPEKLQFQSKPVIEEEERVEPQQKAAVEKEQANASYEQEPAESKGQKEDSRVKEAEVIEKQLEDQNKEEKEIELPIQQSVDKTRQKMSEPPITIDHTLSQEQDMKEDQQIEVPESTIEQDSKIIDNTIETVEILESPESKKQEIKQNYDQEQYDTKKTVEESYVNEEFEAHDSNSQKNQSDLNLKESIEAGEVGDEEGEDNDAKVEEEEVVDQEEGNYSNEGFED